MRSPLSFRLHFCLLPAFLLLARLRAAADGGHALHVLLRLVGGRADARDAEAELVRVRRAAQRLLHRDKARMVEREERLVEGLHAVLRGAGGDGVAYERGLLLVDDVVAYEASGDQHLGGGHATVARGGADETHRDDRTQNACELYAHALLKVRRERRDDAADGLGRVGRGGGAEGGGGG